MATRYTAIVDGGTNGLNGRGATGTYGSYRIDDNELAVVVEHAERVKLDGKTNNEAEYQILIACLEAVKRSNLEGVEIASDSRLVVEQVNGKWKIKAENLIELRNVACNLMLDTDSTLIWRGKYASGGTYERLGH